MNARKMFAAQAILESQGAAHGEAMQCADARVWTAQRDIDMWPALEG